MSITDANHISIIYVVLVNTAAWIVGFLSFIPTGLGVREVVLVLLFMSSIGGATVIAASLIQRMVELACEGVLWLVATWVLTD
jgi:uncharacterized protein (TIRG00374 family)